METLQREKDLLNDQHQSVTAELEDMKVWLHSLHCSIIYARRRQGIVGASLRKHHVYVLVCVLACMLSCVPKCASLRMAEDMHVYD